MSRRFSRSEKAKWVPSASSEPKRSPVKIPLSNNSDLIAANKLTIIGKVTNPTLQRPRAVVEFLPQVWNLEGRVSGRELGPEKFQIRFESEADLQAVLSKGPYHYKKWMLLLQQWEPTVKEAFPSSISFWLRVHDLPLHFWNDPTLDVIGKQLGVVEGKKADDARVRVRMNGLHPLIMNLEIQLPSEEVTTVEFEYLKIEKHCFTCFSLFHEETECPSKPRNQPPPKDRKLGITQQIALQRIEADKRRHDDRRGYSRAQPQPKHARSLAENGRDHRSQSYSYGGSYRSSRRSPSRSLEHRGAQAPATRDQQHTSPPDRRANENYPRREHSSGQIVLSKNSNLRHRHGRDEALGANTSQDNASYNSRTPPSRSARDRLIFPTEISSERTLTTSREKRSALERIESDLRNTTPLSTSRLGKRKERDTCEGSVPQEEMADIRTRTPAPLRLEEPALEIDSVTVSIPASQSKSGTKRRVTSTTRRVPRSPLRAMKLKKAALARVALPPRKKTGAEKEKNLPCNKAGTSVFPRSTSTRSQKRKQTGGQDFHPPPPPLP